MSVTIKQATIDEIKNGKTFLGIELGSTRIKAVLIDSNHAPIVSGNHDWENKLVDGFWTYSLEDIWKGLQDCYADLNKNVQTLTGEPIKRLASIGFSSMMHGYLAFDSHDQLLVPFRTWRNSNTGKAAEKLTALFKYNIPQRWSIAHLYQAILDKEPHVKEVDFFTTLAGYLHWQLTGKKVLGVGDASGMFPINPKTVTYDAKMIQQFNELTAPAGFKQRLENLLPEIKLAGEEAGTLSEAGAKLLDVSGHLQAGIPLCPPEGDAGTGMTATNSVAKRTGNVSAGTSVFAMIVLEKELEKVHPEIDLVTTPDGKLVAMVHANNCSSDINSWVKLFNELIESLGMTVDTSVLYETLFKKALEGEPDGGGLLSYGYYSGENITEFAEGRPLFVHAPDNQFNLANFMRTHLMSALGALKIGMDILVNEEQVHVDEILGHGGFFKTEKVGQKMMAAAMNTTVSVMETAGEGGAWGMALLAAYLIEKNGAQELSDFLTEQVFSDNLAKSLKPEPEDVAGFEAFIKRYKKGLPIEQAAVEHLI